MSNHSSSSEQQFRQAEDRAAYLRYKPLARGNFNRQHLTDIHAFIFEPFLGDDQYRPGEFREETRANRIWGKARNEDEGYSSYRVFYSKMDAAAHERLDSVLERMKPENLRQLDADNLTKELSNNYAELDYIHPFKEGNSRALREFFSQCAEEIGYVFTLNHESESVREDLYAARDKAVLEKVYSSIDSEKVKQEINDTLFNKLDLADTLEDFFKDNLHAMNLYEKADFRGCLKDGAEKETNLQTRALLKEKLESFDRYIKDRDRAAGHDLSR